jgi:hypothetical protein
VQYLFEQFVFLVPFLIYVGPNILYSLLLTTGRSYMLDVWDTPRIRRLWS